MAEIYGETQRMVPLQKVLPRQARDGGGLCEETGDGWLSGVELVKKKKKKHQGVGWRLDCSKRDSQES